MQKKTTLKDITQQRGNTWRGTRPKMTIQEENQKKNNYIKREYIENDYL